MTGPTTHRERNRTTESSRERAVSDIVAFVLTFSIIIAGVGIVSVGGFDQLTEFTNNQQLENSDRGMQAAASTVDKLHRNSDTYRQFDLALGGGNVWYNETSIDVTIGGNETTYHIDALEHRFDLSYGEVSLAYEGGGMFRTNSASPRHDPAIRCSGDEVIVSLVNLTAAENIHRSGAYASEIVLQPTGVPQESPVSADNQFMSLRAELVGQERILETDDDGIELEVDVSETAYPAQWGQYFEAEGWDSTPADDVYECSGETVLVRVSTIELSLLQRDPVT